MPWWMSRTKRIEASVLRDAIKILKQEVREADLKVEIYPPMTENREQAIVYWGTLVAELDGYRRQLKELKSHGVR